MNLKDNFNNIFKKEGIDYVTYTGWDFADKEKDPKQEFTLDSEEFTDSLIQSIQEYRRHKALTAKQDDSIKTLRKNVPPHQAVVVLDYSENYKKNIRMKSKQHITEISKYQCWVPMLTTTLEMERGSKKRGWWYCLTV